MTLLQRFFTGVEREYDDDWVAPDVRQSSIHEKRLDTMVLDKRKKMPFAKETQHGKAVRATDNLALLGELDEAAIVHHLRARYREDVIYTSVGEILIACNPFKPIDIYGTAFQKLFLASSPTVDVPPHIYQVRGCAVNLPGGLVCMGTRGYHMNWCVGSSGCFIESSV